jgi:hypothetical protein
LGPHFILTPERYNPKRRMDLSDLDDGVVLSEIITLENDTITMKKSCDVLCYQINTSDALGGCLRIPPQKERLNSNKKILKKGDVIISRLRPYLRQVAFVDTEKGTDIIGASTEFYVLRARNQESIAYLVPFLLSDPAQTVFANSVEGSQHPRFKEEDLLQLVIPREIYDKREEISRHIEEAIDNYRKYEQALDNELRSVNASMQHE